MVSADVSGVHALALRDWRGPVVLEVPLVIVHVGPSHLPLPAVLGGAVERRMLELAAAEPRVSATAIQTVGSKGYDGFLIAAVIA